MVSDSSTLVFLLIMRSAVQLSAILNRFGLLVLPRFEITVKVPEKQSVGEEELKIEVCAK